MNGGPGKSRECRGQGRCGELPLFAGISDETCCATRLRNRPGASFEAWSVVFNLVPVSGCICSVLVQRRRKRVEIFLRFDGLKQLPSHTQTFTQNPRRRFPGVSLAGRVRDRSCLPAIQEIYRPRWQSWTSSLRRARTPAGRAGSRYREVARVVS